MVAGYTKLVRLLEYSGPLAAPPSGFLPALAGFMGAACRTQVEVENTVENCGRATETAARLHARPGCGRGFKPEVPHGWSTEQQAQEVAAVHAESDLGSK